MPSGRVKTTSQVQDEEVKLLYLNGLTQNKIAKTLNLGYGVVARIVREANISTVKDGRWRKYNLRNSYFEKIDTEEKAYFLGLLFADGNVEKESNAVTLGLDTKDKYLVEKFVQAVVVNFEGFNFYKKRNLCVAVLKDPMFKQNLINMGCVPKKSLIIECPTGDQVPNHLLRHFFRGCFDGDGCAYLSKPNKNGRCRFQASFISGSERFMKQITQRVSSNGLTTPKIRTTKHKNSLYTITFASMISVKNLYKFLYEKASIFLPRKKEKFEAFFKIKNS